MSFGLLTTPAPDPVLALMSRFRADPRPRKIDLGVGMYRDSSGHTPVFAAVKSAEAHLAANQTSKAYRGVEGDPEFVSRLGATALGWRGGGLQTVGGSGALRLAAELLVRAHPQRRIWLGAPSWQNHAAIFAAARLHSTTVELVDATTQGYRPEALLAALQRATPGDAVLIQGCCHNPTGIDPGPTFWAELAALVVARELVPLVDLAYQGLGRGWSQDGAGVQWLAARVPHLLVAYSCDKNFGLYRERVGALFLAAPTARETGLLLSHAVTAARASYSMPPDHGAAVVQHILGSEPLRAAWQTELDGMRARIQRLRLALAAQGCVGGIDLAALAAGHGMFATLPLSPPEIEQLQTDHGIYMAHSGRINIAGLAEADVERFSAALDAVRRKSAA